MVLISVSEAASRLDVDVSRIFQRIADGSLAAEKVGHRWVIDDAAVERVDRRGAGRPLSPRSAWALALVARSDTPGLSAGDYGCDASAALPFSPVDRSRGRSRLRHLLRQVRAPQESSASAKFADDSSVEPSVNDDEDAAVASLARILLKNRAGRLLFRCSPRDLADLRRDSRMKLAGISSSAAGIAAADIVEAYLPAGELAHLVEEFLLVDADRAEANVVLHVVGDDQPVTAAVVSSWLLLAADLAEYHRPRETVRSAQILRAAAQLRPQAAADGNG